eukprot:m.90670 g.90670  ORF g.90670 m.90670 type:complete len:165 (+) comp12919_c0_seq8:325-819(+)
MSSRSHASVDQGQYIKDPHIRVGSGYQATLPKCNPATCLVSVPAYIKHPMQVWSATACPLTEKQVANYVKEVTGTVGYKLSIDQALGALYYNNFNTEAAKQDLLQLRSRPELAHDYTDAPATLALFNALFKRHDMDFAEIAKQVQSGVWVGFVEGIYLFFYFIF